MRKIYSFSLFIALACIIQFQVYAQQSRSNYSLLWKISGNGLKKPSYLFGTMHLKDKRVFEFSDSVLVKLDECPAFAMEILPDTIIKAIFTQYLSNAKEDTTDKLRQILTREEYELLDKRLQEESGMSINKLKSKEPWVINMLLDKSVVVPRKSDKSTFLDAYFYRLAKQQNKKLIGLEKLEEQTSLIDDYSSLKDQIKTIRTKLDKTYESKFLEDMIKLYWSGDVEKLYATIYKGGINESYRYKVLTVRNQTMVERLSNYIREEQTFIAVGAAHLPGDDGMIKLLQKKGFTVTPVKSTFTGMAAKYKEKIVHEKWYTFISKENAYAIDLPSEPFPLELDADKGNPLVTMYTLPDLATGMVYYCASFTLPTKIEPAKQDELFKRMVEGMVKDKSSKLLSEKNVTFDGYPGREVELYDGKEAMYMRCRVYLRRNFMYMLMAGGTREQLNGRDALRFLDSFRLQNFAPADWKEFTDSDGAFRIQTPVAFSKQTREQDIENMPGVKAIQTIHVGVDQQKGMSYTALIGDFSAGYVIMDDSIYFNNVISLASQRTKGKISNLRNISLQSFPGRAYTIVAPDANYYFRVYLRGSRIYYLIVTTPSAEEALKAEAETFLNSFAFTELKRPTWQEYKAADGDFTVKVPGKVIVDTDSTDNAFDELQNITYTSNNPNSGLSYFVVRSRYSDYFEAKDENTLFKQLVEASVHEKDTLLKETSITIDGMPGREIFVQTRGNHTVRRTRMALRGGELYQLLMYVPETWIDEATVSAFFDSFHFGKQAAKGNVFTKKSEKLFTDLGSADTLVQKKAKRAISSFDFTIQDLPAIYKAIGRTYADDSAEYGSTKLLLIQALSRVNDHGTLEFIKQLYPALPEDNPSWQLAVLRALIAINSRESLTLFTDLMVSKIPKASFEQSLFYNLADSLDNSKVMFPKIMALHNIPEYTNNLYWLTSQLCEKNMLTSDELALYSQQILTDGKAKLARHLQMKKDSEGYYQDVHTLELLTGLLAHYPDNKECIALLTQMMTSSNDDLALAAGLILLKNNTSIDKKRFGAIAANRSLSLQLYNELTSLKKMELFPKKYLTQEHFAEASLVNYLLFDEDGSEPDKILLLGTKETEYNGKRGHVYIYKFMYKGEDGEKDKWYVAISGLQPLDKKQVSAESELTNTAWSLLEEKSIEEHYQELLQQAEPIF